MHAFNFFAALFLKIARIRPMFKVLRNSETIIICFNIIWYFLKFLYIIYKSDNLKSHTCVKNFYIASELYDIIFSVSITTKTYAKICFVKFNFSHPYPNDFTPVCFPVFQSCDRLPVESLHPTCSYWNRSIHRFNIIAMLFPFFVKIPETLFCFETLYNYISKRTYCPPP